MFCYLTDNRSIIQYSLVGILGVEHILVRISCIYSSSLVKSTIILYSDSVLDIETIIFFLLFDDIRFPLTKAQ